MSCKKCVTCLSSDRFVLPAHPFGQAANHAFSGLHRKGSDHSLKEYYYILLDVELQEYTTEPYVSFASGNISQTISTYFRDAANNTLYVLCIDVLAQD